MSQTYALKTIAEHVGGELEGDGDREVSGVAPIHKASAQDLAFLESPKYRQALEKTNAAAVIVAHDVEAPRSKNLIRAAQPVVAWARAVALICPRQRLFTDISGEAYLGRDVVLGDGVGIGPGAYVGDGVEIGAGTEIYPGVTIGPDTTIGADCVLYGGAHVYGACRLGDRVIVHSGAVLGADGYGYAQERREDPAEPIIHAKVPQVGTLIIEDDVEIGANATIDRAALEATVIGRGTKVDNLVMVGHNCRTGKHCLLVGQVGLAGSNILGDYVTIAGQAGLSGHLKVGSRAIIGAKAGVLKDVEEGQVVHGSPGIAGGQALRAYSQIENLPEFRRTLQDLQKRVAELEARLEKAGE